MMVAVVEIADPLDVGKNVARIGVVATIPVSMMDDEMVVEGPKAEMVMSAIADVNTLVGVVKLDENTRREIGVAVGAKVIVKAVGEEFEGARSPVGMTMDELPFDEAERDAMLEAHRPGMSIADFTRRLLEIEQLGTPEGYPLSEPAHVEENWKREQKARRYVQKRHMDDQAVEERTLGNDMWGVWDNDKREWVVKDETYQVTANVEYALNHGATGTSECDEVARSILDADGKHKVGIKWTIGDGKEYGSKADAERAILEAQGDSTPYDKLKNLTVEHIVKIHDGVATTGGEKCPVGKNAVYYSKPLDDLVAWLRTPGGSPESIASQIFMTIVGKQPFQDCNHRTAWATAIHVLRYFGQTIEVPEDEKVKMLGDIYGGKVTRLSVESWVRQYLRALNSAEPSLSSVGASRLSTSASIKSNSSSKVMNTPQSGKLSSIQPSTLMASARASSNVDNGSGVMNVNAPPTIKTLPPNVPRGIDDRVAAYLTYRYLRTFELVVQELTKLGTQPGKYKEIEVHGLLRYFRNMAHKQMSALDFTGNLISGLLVRHALPNVNHRTTLTFINDLMKGSGYGLGFDIHERDPRFTEYLVGSKAILHTRKTDPSGYGAKHLDFTREWMRTLPQSGKLASIGAKSLIDSIISRSMAASTSEWTDMIAKYTESYIKTLLRSDDPNPNVVPLPTSHTSSGKEAYLLVTAGAKAYPEAVKHAIALAYERIDKPPRILWSLGRRGIGADGISTPSDNVGASPRLVKLNEEGRPSTGQSRSVPARALSGEPPPGRKLEVQAPFLRGESLTKGATDFITIDMQPRVVATHLREARGEGYEDEGRTYRAYWPKELGHAPKFYVKLDDYGTPEALKESLGKYYPQGSSTQTVITIMLATED